MGAIFTNCSKSVHMCVVVPMSMTQDPGFKPLRESKVVCKEVIKVLREEMVTCVFLPRRVTDITYEIARVRHINSVIIILYLPFDLV